MRKMFVIVIESDDPEQQLEGVEVDSQQLSLTDYPIRVNTMLELDFKTSAPVRVEVHDGDHALSNILYEATADSWRKDGTPIG